jgi:long-subunit acyl-CoA synthetase (AMP-forming)
MLRSALKVLAASGAVLETYDRQGACIRKVSGLEFVERIRALRPRFAACSSSGDGRRAIALLFKPEETIEFLTAAIAAMAEGFVIVPLYPNWSAETQLAYLHAYRLRAIAFGEGFRARAESWNGSAVECLVPVGAEIPADQERSVEAFPEDVSPDTPCAWIFTSGTSGKLAKLTEITFENLEAAIANIQRLDFLEPGMTVHCPLSASHIFAFVVILGFLTIEPRRVIFSDAQYLARLPESRTGRVDGLILVPIVLHRMRAAFYEKLTAELDPATAPPELRPLARIPIGARKLLKRVVLRAEHGVIELERRGRTNPAAWAAVRLARRLFGRLVRAKLGSPRFVVVGGAKPSLEGMAFLEVMGIRCLQGWGMTETTGPLAVCRLGDRFRGAFGTCGTLFDRTRAYIDSGELVVEGPQIARGYHQPDGTFVPFHGKKRTGDHAEFDGRGRLKVLGKASDRITTENGINYNPIPVEEDIQRIDLDARHIVEEVVVVGDGRPRLGAVFFLREGVPHDAATRAYLAGVIREINARSSIDERIVPWAVSEVSFKESGVLGPSGKLVRRRVEERFAAMFESAVELVT